GGDLIQRDALRGRERKGKRIGDLRADTAVADDDAAALRLHVLADETERELAREQLVVGDALPRGGARRDVGGVAWPVQAGQRLTERRPATAREPLAVLPFHDVRHALERLPRRLLQHFSRKTGGQRV